MQKVSIVGVGRVGGALALSLPPTKYDVAELVVRARTDVVQRVARDLPSARVVELEGLDKSAADIVFITTQDSEIEPAVDRLAKGVIRNATVFHTSGALSSSVLSSFSTMGCSIGSIHPLVSISSPELGSERFRGAYFSVEGDTDAVALGRKIAEDLGGRPFSIDTKFKTLYHASAVTACGHLVALFDAAVEMMTKCGLTGTEARDVLLPLVLSTVQNLEHQNTAAALTGTFARADIQTFMRHLTALNENVTDDLLEIYLLLGERSLELAAKQGVSPDRVESMRAKVTIAKSKLKW